MHAKKTESLSYMHHKEKMGRFMIQYKSTFATLTSGHTTITAKGRGFDVVGNPLLKIALTLPGMEPVPRTDCVCVLSKFNGTSTPKGSYRAKTGDNDRNVNSSLYSLSTALCESTRYQAKSEQNVRQDLIPRVRHGEAALCTPRTREYGGTFSILFDVHM